MAETNVTADLEAFLASHVFEAPPGVEIRRSRHGLSLHVTHPVRAGEVIYRADEIRIPVDARKFRALVLIQGQVHDLEITTMHTVRYNGIRTFDIPGCFMNHSCDPSSVSRDLNDESVGAVTAYEQIAVHDLEAGDEITCDYTLFDWDCDGHQFECGCGSPRCYGFVGGFCSLPTATQVEFADRIYYESERMWTLTRS